MIRRFPTYESACLFAAEQRAEGHFAQVLDDIVGTMWTPATVGGVRVLTSDQPVSEDSPALPAGDSTLMRFVRILTLAIASTVPAFLLLALILWAWVDITSFFLAVLVLFCGGFLVMRMAAYLALWLIEDREDTLLWSLIKGLMMVLILMGLVILNYG